MGFLSKVIGAVTGAGRAVSGLDGSQVGWVKAAVASLDTVRAGLADKAFEFVTEGTQETVLLDLQAAQGPATGALMGSPGRLRSSFHVWNDEARQAMGVRSLAAQAKLFASIDPASPPLEALVRLGKVLAAADGGQSLDHPGSPVPDWLQYLVNDALHASFNSHSTPIELLFKTRPAWTVSLVAALLAREGLDETLALQASFERKGLDSYYANRLDALVQPELVSAFMRLHRQAVEALPGQLSASGRVALANRIGRDRALLNDFAALFMVGGRGASRVCGSRRTAGRRSVPRRCRISRGWARCSGPGCSQSF